MVYRMKIVSWNVNSIKVRLGHVEHYLDRAQPDVLMLQELKGMDFPAEAFKAAGYESHAIPQKARNGVAVISKAPVTVVLDHLPGDKSDEQARYLEFDYEGLRLINIYLPNGNPAPGEKYDYKLAWMDRLYARLAALRKDNVAFAIGGDFNVIPEAKDCYDPKSWENDALFMLESRRRFRRLVNLGLSDALRVHNTLPGEYTFWDYQRGAWEKNHGIRIDHFLLSPTVADRLVSCTIDTEPRGQDKPSDHTPIMIELAA